MRRSFLLVGFSLLLVSNSFLNLVKAEENPQPQSKAEIKKQIDVERQKQINYHIKEIESLKKGSEQLSYLSEYGFDTKNIKTTTNATYRNLDSDLSISEEITSDYFEELLENAYIFTMDENGYVYDREGEVVNKLDLKEEQATGTNSIMSASLDTSISGYNTGAFVRQTTKSGYKGIRTTFTLPTDTKFETPSSGVTGYLYNGIDVLSSSNVGYKLEGGLQYSETYDNYSASIHPQGLSQNAIPEGYSSAPPRYAQDTAIVSNLLYDTSSSQFKYFVNGINVKGDSQYIYFYYSKSFTSNEIAALAVKRVTALAKAGYTGENIGKVEVKYDETAVTSNSGTTSSMTSSILSTHTYNGKTYGTSDTPSSAVTKSGEVSAQKIIVDTTNF
ncbi:MULTISPECIES: hypothetical protein [Paenibacillus]|uniref:hypothetical protein n=1 Tax=Paenibacillus TaxID=44249 RepID=UPI00073F184F|nr:MULTISPECIES: hypothetical protein [Paenibacillus]MDU4697847.1 hypothetical protein [Paenibacillus sp.]